MAIIWGFDLSEMSWSAFGSKSMFDKRWYLRKERFIIYQIAMLTGLAAECTATYSLSKYNFQESDVEEASGSTVMVFNDDIYDASVLTIVFCVLVATLFGADFFFLVFWPRRKYPTWYNWTKKALAVVITMGMCAAAIMSTVVITTHEAIVEGPDPVLIDTLLQRYSRPPLVYRRWPQNIAWLVLIWIAFISTLASTVVMFIAVAHDTRYGPHPYPRDSDGLEDGPRNESISSFGTPNTAGFSRIGADPMDTHRGRPDRTGEKEVAQREKISEA